MTAPYRVSVIIPTYQRRASLQRVLQALSRQTLPPEDYEVIVSIDGSQDGSQEMVSRFPAPYRLYSIWRPNRGRSAACNDGIREARGHLLVLLDDDMEPIPRFLAAHLEAHPEGSQLGVVGAVPITPEQPSTPLVEYIGLRFNHHLRNLAQPCFQFKLRDFYSGNFSIQRDILLEVGPFDESFRIYGHEDFELYVRLSKAGVQLVYSSEALAYQHYVKSFAALSRDTIAEGRTAVLLASKHPDTFGDLKLSTYQQDSRKWFLVRAGLLSLSRLWVRLPDWVALCIAWAEKRRLTRFHYYCYLALDYCYWLGAWSALRENRKVGQGLTSLSKPTRESRS
jgi:GT2 family glycosyltransferase